MPRRLLPSEFNTVIELARLAEIRTLREELQKEYRAIVNLGYSRQRYHRKPGRKKPKHEFIKSSYLRQLKETNHMRAVIIDPWAKKVHAIIQPSFSLHEMYAALSHSSNAVDDINSVSLGRIYLWVDGEGLLKKDIPVWKLNGYPSPLAGKGLLLGIDETGENTQCNLAVEHVRDMVQWTDLTTSGRLTAPRTDGFVHYLGNGILKTDGGSDAEDQ